ncbi:hypothetical protein ACFLYW_00265 [Thermodesulfobacteriota bacterium]
MIDPELKYCPECNDEYRAEIEQCAGCGIDLITGRQKIEMEEARQQKLATRTGELDPDDDLVLMRRGPLAEMRHLATLLDAEKIATAMIGDMKSCAKDRFGNSTCCPTVYNLLVRKEDGREAYHVIEEDHRRVTGLAHHGDINDEAIYNPHESEAQCPACGHTFPTTETACPDCGLRFG